MTGNEIQQFTKQTTQVSRKTYGKTGTHKNTTTKQQEMLGIAGELNGTRTFWIIIYKGV
jgi:hypothetical protein